jgi:alkylresorcinol/alkylpyrone synthase
MVGMGCGAAIPALEQAHHFTLAHPGSLAAVVSTEICSAAMFSNDAIDIVISNTIFGDGSAAVLLQSQANSHTPSRNGISHPRLHSFSSLVIPEWRECLRFQLEGGYLKNVLAKEVPEQAGKAMQKIVSSLLKDAGLAQEDIRYWIMHAGGEKIIDTLQQSLGLSDPSIDSSRDILKNFGNMSSPTVLFVLEKEMQTRPCLPGEWGIMGSFGAGFSAHGALLEF